jgi:hypothetical protein
MRYETQCEASHASSGDFPLRQEPWHGSSSYRHPFENSAMAQAVAPHNFQNSAMAQAVAPHNFENSAMAQAVAPHPFENSAMAQAVAPHNFENSAMAQAVTSGREGLTQSYDNLGGIGSSRRCTRFNIFCSRSGISPKTSNFHVRIIQPPVISITA